MGSYTTYTHDYHRDQADACRFALFSIALEEVITAIMRHQKPRGVLRCYMF